MTPAKYPLCEALGVPVRVARLVDRVLAGKEYDVVCVSDLERYLEQLPKWECAFRSGELLYAKPGYFPPEDVKGTARVILEQPIVRDTAESLLRERIAFHESFNGRTCSPGEAAWLDRARKLLEREGM